MGLTSLKCSNCGFELKKQLQVGMWIKFRLDRPYDGRSEDVGKILDLNPPQILKERTICVKSTNGSGHIPIKNIIKVVSCGVNV